MLAPLLDTGEKYPKTTGKRPCPKAGGYLNWSLETHVGFSVM